ncbi:arylesterase [Methylophilus medardicus]|uniref:Arylesterase n=1 Tax=Methylophilus medardicus TaxID=2588534 RepID=A0A5B8CVY8_9PROT|nr:arylesterase [Methylophilus medardicus]QDC45240.1 arylesterase [Methylophilus medardicus]QDC50247.1 arylesterase [Methylophilus medardicus]QDC53952.1 arylesterase [Methylophilus medardicus]
MFRFLKILSVIAGLLFTSLAMAESSKPVILFFGDSLSAAYGIPKEQGWVNLVALRLKDKQLPYEVANASVSGETTAGGLSRLPAALKQFKPSIVVIELGANDGLRGLPLDAMKNNLEKMIQASQQVKAKVVLLGMLIPPNYGPKYTQGFKAIYADLSDKYKIPFVPFFLEGVSGHRELVIEDGLHPNVIAQPKILDNVWPTLQPLFH